jgi:uncharacterized protein
LDEVRAIASRYAQLSRAAASGREALYDALRPDEWTVEEAGDWALGFIEAATLNDDDWLPLIRSSMAEGTIFPISLVAFARKEELLSETPSGELAIPAAVLRDMLPTAALSTMYFWDDYNSRPRPVVRGHKTGRNDPCPCGSSRKYKRCCGAN